MDTAPSRSRVVNDLDVNEALEVFSNGRRRIVLEEVLKCRPVSMAALVDRVVTAESDAHDLPEDLRDEVALSHYHKHKHLPELADSNTIDHDTERGLITVRDAAYATEPYLELARTVDRHW